MESLSRPDFLDRLATDLDGAFADFYRLAVTLLTRKPPRALRAVAEADRPDVIQDIVAKFARNDCRLLCAYRDVGRPFVAWFYAIASNTCIDHLRRAGRQPVFASPPAEGDDTDFLETIAASNPGPDEQHEVSDALAVVRASMARLGRRCRLLLQMAADGFTPRQMATALRQAPDRNKKLSDDLRYCRRKLVDELVREGFDPQQLSGASA